MTRKYGVDATDLAVAERKVILEKAFNRSVSDYNGVINDSGLYGYAELMLAFGLTREGARRLIQQVASAEGSKGRISLTQKESFVFGIDLRLYLESICSAAEIPPPVVKKRGSDVKSKSVVRGSGSSG